MRTRYKTVGALAKAVGMTESGFSRAMKAGTLETENCLRLAVETGVAPACLTDATLKDPTPPATSAGSGVPYFVFNGRLSLSGAQDAAVLVRAMSHAMQAKETV